MFFFGNHEKTSKYSNFENHKKTTKNYEKISKKPSTARTPPKIQIFPKVYKHSANLFLSYIHKSIRYPIVPQKLSGPFVKADG